MIDQNVFNTEKSDYETPSLFFGEKAGLFDTVNKKYPEIWDIYKTIKSLDWSEDEFNYSTCVNDFKHCDKSTYDMMIKTLAWQWEADSFASRISPLVGSVVTSSELWAAWQRLSDQECFVEGTEVLTPVGWMDLSEVTTETLVAQYELDGSVEFVKPSRVVEKDYSGVVYSYSTNQGHVHQTVTPKHRMYYRQNKGMKHIIAQADDENWSYGAHSTGKSFVLAGKSFGEVVELTPYERFVIAAQADGSISARYTGDIVGTVPVWFSFSKERKIERFLWICQQAELDFVELTGCEASGNKNAQRSFKVNIPVDRLKDMKNFDMFSLNDKSHLWCRDFLEEVSMWDGHDTKKNVKLIETCDRKVSEFCQAVASCAGYKTHFREYIDDRSDKFNNTYRVSWKDQDYHTLQSAKRETLEYDGVVRCVTVDSGLILVRYNGAVSVSGNCVHAATYSEIVRNSFEDPSVILDEILAVEESLDRLETVSRIMGRAHQTAHKHALGMTTGSQEEYNDIFMFAVGMLVLERIQFMSSFAITFAICDTGMFQPIGKAVQKIAQDEFETHVELDKAVIRHEMKTERGKVAYEQCKGEIQELVEEIIDSEIKWVDYLFSEGRELIGLNADILKEWTKFCARDVVKFMKVECNYKLPTTNPLKFMENWLNIGKSQGSPQEEDIAQYKVNVMRRDDDGFEFDTDF